MDETSALFRQISIRATQAIIALIVLAPPLEVMLAGRNLYGEEFYSTALPVAPIPVMTIATALVGLLSCLIIALNVRNQPLTGNAPRVMLGFLVFFATNVFLCIPFGEGAYFSRSNIYPLVLFVAIYLSRDDGAEPMIDAAKTSLLVMMVASLLGLFLMPEATRRVWAPEVRLPFVDFRFWGFGEHANAISPMAIVLALLTLYRPFASRFVTWLGLASAGLVILLAQSQTGWFIALVTIPLFLIYQDRSAWSAVMKSAEDSNVRLAVAVGMLAIALIYFALSMFGGDATILGQIEGEEDLILTGRPEVWRIAIETFEQHPIFGYGLLAWEQEFRDFVNMPWAYHAHNQLLQSLSVAGLVGAAGLIYYTWTLVAVTWQLSRATRALAPALLFIILIRMITEVPLNLGAILLGDTVVHLLLFRLLTSMPADTVQEERPAERRSASIA